MAKITKENVFEKEVQNLLEGVARGNIEILTSKNKNRGETAVSIREQGCTFRVCLDTKGDELCVREIDIITSSRDKKAKSRVELSFFDRGNRVHALIEGRDADGLAHASLDVPSGTVVHEFMGEAFDGKKIEEVFCKPSTKIGGEASCGETFISEVPEHQKTKDSIAKFGYIAMETSRRLEASNEKEASAAPTNNKKPVFARFR